MRSIAAIIFVIAVLLADPQPCVLSTLFRPSQALLFSVGGAGAGVVAAKLGEMFGIAATGIANSKPLRPRLIAKKFSNLVFIFIP